ncbi:MAG TPA: response regulator [Geminicoccaceae bacterium]|nr:response regulator [Geminicoccaceae bacterium]
MAGVEPRTRPAPGAEPGPVLVLAPIGRDAEAARLVLEREGIACRVCAGLEELCRALGPTPGAAGGTAGGGDVEEVGAVLLAEEALLGGGRERLQACLAAQPPWSDLPFVLLTSGTLAARQSLPRLRLGETLGNVMLLERPLHALTLASAVRTALRARQRQYQVRDHLLERERAAAALRESEARYRTLAEALPQLVWTCRADGSCDYLSRQWVAYTGIAEAEQLGLGWLDRVIHPDDRDRTLACWRDAVAGRGDYDLEYRIRGADGAYRWFKTRGVPLRDEAGRIARWFGTCTDISDVVEARETLARGQAELERLVQARTLELEREMAERRQAEEALLQAQKMEAVGQMTGGVAHDFNNLLTVLIGNLDLIGRAAGDPARVQELAAAALEAAGRAERLTQQLLAFARRQTLRPAIVDASRLIGDFAGLLRHAVGEAVELETVLEPALDACRVDPAQLEAALLNLVVNARDAVTGDAAGGGRITISTRNVAFGAEAAARDPELASGAWVLVAVADTGSGIPPEALGRVFDPFYTTKEVGKGTGLGLSQVYGFVRQSGGHVRLRSALGRGTTVELYLPRAAGVPAEPAPVAAAAAPGPTAGRARGETVLVVEDEPGVRALAVAALAELGYRVRVAGNAAAALALLEGGQPVDLLFTDVVMPGGMNGAELAAAARRLRPRLRVLLTSGYPAHAPGGEDGLVAELPILAKPYRPAELAARVRAALDGPPAGAEARPGAMNGRRALRVLLVEDEALVRLATAGMLEELGHAVIEAPSAEAALEVLRQDGAVDVLFTDVGLPGMSGLELAAEARRRAPDLKIVLASGYGAEPGQAPGPPGTVRLAKPYLGDDLALAFRRLRQGEG